MHNIKILIISSHSKMFILIHNIHFLLNKNYFFKFTNSVNFVIYVYFVNIKIKTILTRNEHNKFIKIFHNFRLKK